MSQIPDFWLTRKDIAEICPPCAKRMAELRIKRVSASAILGQDVLKLSWSDAAAWESMPKGWTKDSLKKFWKSVGESVSKCSEKMKGKISDPDAFCASIKDKIEKSTKWRGED
jgi:hypothetical protein